MKHVLTAAGLALALTGTAMAQTPNASAQAIAANAQEALARWAIDTAGAAAWAEHCGWAGPPSRALASKAVEAMIVADFAAEQTATDLGRLNAAITTARQQGSSRPCTGPDGGPHPALPQIATVLDQNAVQMLVNLEAYDTEGGWHVWLRLTDAQREAIAVAVNNAMAPNRTAFWDSITERMTRVRALTPLACRERAADTSACGRGPAGSEVYAPSAKVTLEQLEAFGAALASEVEAERAAITRAMPGVPLAQLWVPVNVACRAGATAYRVEPGLVRREAASGLNMTMAFVRRYSVGQAAPAGWSLLFSPNSGIFGGPKFHEIAGSTRGEWSEAEARLAVGDLTAAPANVLRPPGRPAGTPADQQSRARVYAETFYTNFKQIGLMAGGVGALELKPCVAGATF